VYAFALVLNEKCERLEWRWLGRGIYSLQPLTSCWLTLVSMGTYTG
jgi:hypothetical protein